jgi:DNA-binding NtrC family response regulator
MGDYKILMVDDESDFLDTIVKRLQKRQLNVRGVYSGQEALGLVTEKKYDVVVLDVRMPGIDGIQTLKRIKQINPLLEVIMLTAHADMELALNGMNLGAFDYLMKPVDIDELVYKIQDACKKKAIQEEKQARLAQAIERRESSV